MRIGTYYYPEQWPAEQWEKDFDHMAAMGMQLVHMGEFAWFRLEPRPGTFTFDWLEKCLDLATKRQMKAILCTPTAAPPIWLIEQHPEILPVDASGRRMRFGGRRHYSPLAPALHEATSRIVSALADRFGNHPSVIGWQIDNEFSGAFDQSDTAHAAFRAWLGDRYKTIDALNEAWGCAFWSTQYTDFSQIYFPPVRHEREGNPHQHLDASRFWSHAFAAFSKLQSDILRPKIGDRFLTTNFMPFHPDCNPADFAGDLNVMSWDAYPVTGSETNPSTEHYRMGDPSAIALVHEQMASYTGRWGQLELQPGQINWSGTPALVYPGAVRLWIWTAFAYGAEFVTTYRFRQPRVGYELFHQGLVGPDGATASIGGREFSQAAGEIKRLGAESLSTGSISTGADGDDPAATVGLLFDFEQLWYYKTLPQAVRWNQQQWLQSWFGAIARLGLRAEVLHPDRPWPQDLKMLIAPGVQMVDDALVERWRVFAEGGGHLVLTCRTATMDRRGQLFDGVLAAPIQPLICGTIEAYDGLPQEKFAEVELDGKRYKWGVWGELLYAGPDTRVLAKYADQFYAGAAAVTRCNQGKGTVTYCGVHGERPFVEALTEKVAASAGLTITRLPWRVLLRRRGPYSILLNYGDQTTEAPAPRGAKFLIGSRKVPPAGVAVWTG